MIEMNKLKHIKVVIRMIYLIVITVHTFTKNEINTLVASDKELKTVKVYI